MSTQDPSIEQIRAASPSSMFSAENGKIQTTIQVLKSEADQADSEWMREELEAVAKYMEEEVKN